MHTRTYTQKDHHHHHALDGDVWLCLFGVFFVVMPLWVACPGFAVVQFSIMVQLYLVVIIVTLFIEALTIRPGNSVPPGVRVLQVNMPAYIRVSPSLSCP